MLAGCMTHHPRGASQSISDLDSHKQPPMAHHETIRDFLLKPIDVRSSTHYVSGVAADTSSQQDDASSDKQWLLDELLKVPRVRHAVLAAADGLVVVKSKTLQDDVAQRLAVGCTGLFSVSTGLAQDHADSTRPRQVVVDLDGALLFVRRAGDDARLAVVAENAVDPAALSRALETALTAIAKVRGASAARSPQPR
jgi:predicted regulator of Ras-like GTPase activity (Roadblock/LC7/MglB family)